jgi:hypothetical protein
LKVEEFAPAYAGLTKLKVVYNREDEEYQVLFFYPNGGLREEATYFAGDKEDAFDTADSWVYNNRVKESGAKAEYQH